MLSHSEAAAAWSHEYGIFPVTILQSSSMQEVTKADHSTNKAMKNMGEPEFAQCFTEACKHIQSVDVSSKTSS